MSVSSSNPRQGRCLRPKNQALPEIATFLLMERAHQKTVEQSAKRDKTLTQTEDGHLGTGVKGGSDPVQRSMRWQRTELRKSIA